MWELTRKYWLNASAMEHLYKLSRLMLHTVNLSIWLFEQEKSDSNECVAHSHYNETTVAKQYLLESPVMAEMIAPHHERGILCVNVLHEKHDGNDSSWLILGWSWCLLSRLASSRYQAFQGCSTVSLSWQGNRLISNELVLIKRQSVSSVQWRWNGMQEDSEDLETKLTRLRWLLKVLL